MGRKEMWIPGAVLVSIVSFLPTALCLAAGPGLGAPGGANPSLPALQGTAPAGMPAVGPRICPTCLPNGTKTSISGDQLFLVGESGRTTPAKDGTYTLQNGSTIVITNGRIAAPQQKSSPKLAVPTADPGRPAEAGAVTGKSPLTAVGGAKATGKKSVQGITGGRKMRVQKPGSQISGSDDEDLEDLEIQR